MGEATATAALRAARTVEERILIILFLKLCSDGFGFGLVNFLRRSRVRELLARQSIVSRKAQQRYRIGSTAVLMILSKN